MQKFRQQPKDQIKAESKMAKEFNEQKMRSKLIALYKGFLENPKSKDIRSHLIQFDRDFGGLAAYNDYLKSQPIPKDISMAIGHVSTIFQYGLGTYENNWILKIARETLDGLEGAAK